MRGWSGEEDKEKGGASEGEVAMFNLGLLQAGVEVKTVDHGNP